MNVAELQKKLIAAARLDLPHGDVPYAFEKRIMARLKKLPVIDAWSLWGASLWRAAAPCVAIMIVLGAWAFCSADFGAVGEARNTDLESTVLAPVAVAGEAR